MKIKPLAFSFTASIIMALIFLMMVFWIFYTHSGDLAATKDALNTTGVFFGGVSTLVAAVVAAYLFSDWRDEKFFEIKIQKIDSILCLINQDKNMIQQHTYPMAVFWDNIEKRVLLNSSVNYKYYPNIDSLAKTTAAIDSYAKLFNDTEVLQIYNLYIDSILHIREEINNFYADVYANYERILERAPNGDDRAYFLTDGLGWSKNRKLKKARHEIVAFFESETRIADGDEKNLLYHVQDYFDLVERLKVHMYSKYHP